MQDDPVDIRAFQRLSAMVTTSGRLRDQDLDALAAIGVRHVVNLALDSHPEAMTDEAAKLAARGIGYTHIPVPFDEPRDELYHAFVAALDAAGDAPVHVHCIMNYRVAAFFYRYHREIAGMPEAEACALMNRQWDPHSSDRPEARPWAEFLERTES
jgi:uncharacterized protein (TIGR01244 family)